MAFIIFIFFIATAISAVAAYFSIVGLGTLFQATFWGVVIMAAVLEVGKIVTTKWVHTNWKNPRAPWFFRGLLCVFIAALMSITSLGIYGYLSKGHLEQSAPLDGLEIQVAQLETQLQQKQTENDQLIKRLDQIGRITDKSLETSGRAGLRAATSQKTESAKIQSKIDENNKVINDLNTKLVPLKTQGAAVEAKLGPVKYFAELFGWEPEAAVRIIIVVIMVAFDPLALSLFIAGSISFKDWKESRKNEDDIEPKTQETDDIDLDTSISEDHIDQELEDLKSELELEKKTVRDQLTALEDMHILEATLQEKENKIQADHEALTEAHQQLVSMEKRLEDERQLLAEWQGQLAQQQEAINKWTPDLGSKVPKEVIIDLLEKNPDIVNDIVQVSQSMRKPGL